MLASYGETESGRSDKGNRRCFAALSMTARGESGIVPAFRLGSYRRLLVNYQSVNIACG